jgi:uncharacterized membrane protein
MKKIIALVMVSIPSLAFAQALAPINNVNDLAKRAFSIGDLVTYGLVGLAVLFIVWNTVWYFIKPNGEGRSQAGLNILWGIVGLAVIVSIWGLVNIFTNSFRTTPTNQAIPNVGSNVNNGGIPANQVPIVQ